MTDTVAIRKRGRPRIADKRIHAVTARLSATELETLDSRRGMRRRGDYLRTAALGVLPPMVPTVNIDAWKQLARAAANLNQISAAFNERGDLASIVEARAVLHEFRSKLIGANKDGDDEIEVMP